MENYKKPFLKPLLSVFAEPFYTVETDLTPEEIAMTDEGMAEYRANPSNLSVEGHGRPE